MTSMGITLTSQDEDENEEEKERERYVKEWMNMSVFPHMIGTKLLTQRHVKQ